MTAFYAGLIFGAALVTAARALLWLGKWAVLDRARDEECYSDATACALATNAVGPAVDRYNAEHPDLHPPAFLPLSLRHAIGRDVAAALAAAKPGASR